jgi:hypothetical protein
LKASIFGEIQVMFKILLALVVSDVGDDVKDARLPGAWREAGPSFQTFELLSLAGSKPNSSSA